MKSAIAIMGRVPLAGTVKTRLMPQLSGAECAVLQMACLMDSCAAAAAAGSPGYLFYAGTDPDLLRDGELLRLFPHQAADAYRENLGRMTLLPQGDGDLGRRMAEACRRVLADHERLVLAGTDIPGLSGPRLTAGLRSLDEADLVLGPALDGGYYLIGMKKLHPEIFSGIAWGSAVVLADTLAAAGRLGLSLVQLAAERDLDTWQDLVAYVRGGGLPADRQALMSYRCAADFICRRNEQCQIIRYNRNK